VGRDRRGRSPALGAHPERRVLAPGRRVLLRRVPGRARGGAAGAALVLPPVINLYERPDAAAPVVNQATLGTAVIVLDASRGWWLVETPDRYRGWVHARALRRLPARARWPRGLPLHAANLLVNVYRERDVTSAAPILVAPLLSRLEALRKAGDWTGVRLPDGRRGWVQTSDVTRDAATAAGDDGVAATALRFIGLPYLWGGTTPFGLDCSGLAQLVYRLHGYLLPRDADLQHADPNLVEVARDAIRAGDLVFFGPDGGSVTHVGIALGGEAFLSATTYRSPVVRRDGLDDPYWAGLYRGAKRLRDER
jgi:cell wall-associated NlpC family hydrolase